MRFLIVIEPTSTGFSAYSPDLHGCIATGSTREEVELRIRRAIGFHIDGMKQEGQNVPTPRASSTYVDVPS